MPEHLWYTLAASLAGAGTGLVGLSAATAMAQILLRGETGAYRVTAIALASDILGSAVASVFGAYAELISRNGNDTVTVPVVNTAI